MKSKNKKYTFFKFQNGCPKEIPKMVELEYLNKMSIKTFSCISFERKLAWKRVSNQIFETYKNFKA